MMPVNNPPAPLPDPESEESLPAAAQWMKEMVEHSTSPQLLPDMTKTVATNQQAAAPLTARQQRIMDSLRGSEKLLPDLPDDAAESLFSWGAEMAWEVVKATDGMDDAAAEDILQPRVRALRRMLQRSGQMVADSSMDRSDALAYIEKQLAVVYGKEISLDLTRDQPGLVADASKSQTGTVGEQIAHLRQIIAGNLSPNSSDTAV